ncbi:MAG: ABC transporter substrate-binding protein [Synergistaceae bacterium]|nr:ABC transporter substrate-binding protein [Synergistaceae bacterium]
MRKVLLVLLAALVLSLLRSVYSARRFGDEDKAAEEFESKIVLGFAQLGAESEWRSSSSASIKEAARKYGVELMFENAQQKQENQIKAIRSFIAHRVDVIAFSPVVELGWDNVLLEAKAEGIPVILVDRHIRTDAERLYAAFIGSDFIEEGRKAGRWLLEKFRNSEGEVKIVELRGTDGSSPTKDRAEGFREMIGNDGRFLIVRSLSGDFMRSKGREVMEEVLSPAYYNPSAGMTLDVLFAHNDDMAMGAIEAMEEHGLRPGRDVVVISVDAQRSALEALRNGKINCIVECTPYIGERLMDLVRQLVAGYEIPSTIYSEETVFTEDDPVESLPVRPY